jgi:hypothetical protein
MFFFSNSRPDYTEKMRCMIDELKKEVGMGGEESEKLDANLLMAEKTFRKRPLSVRIGPIPRIKLIPGQDRKINFSPAIMDGERPSLQHTVGVTIV